MNRLSCLITGVAMLVSCTAELGDPTDPAGPEATAAISPAALPTTVYNLTGRTSPAAAATAINIDTPLTMTFDGPPVLGTGTVQILRQSDDAVVDTIKIGAETDAIGFPGQGRVRQVNVNQLLSVSGNTLRIVPHHAKLAYATTYYVGINTGVVTGAALNGKAFNGIGKAGAWSFTTKAAPASSLTTLVVDDDGVADFRTVQGALDFVMKNAALNTAVTINVHNGTYQELLFLRSKNNVHIVGQSRTGVIIQYRNYDGLNSGTGGSQTPGATPRTGGRSVFLIEAADLVTLDTLTLQNTMLRSTTVASQAETIYFNNDGGRLIAKNTTFLSEQDTVQVKGYSWFFNSLIAGNVDFIWGGNRVALFENSEIRSVGDTTNASSGGFVVQARTVTATDKGFVFLNSRLTHGPGPGPAHGDVPTGSRAATYLARSPGTSTTFDNVAYINCQMDTHIIPRGWAYNTAGQPVSNPAVATAASGWREFGTTTLSGAAVNLATRIGGHLLTTSEVAAGFSNRAQIFAAFGGGAGWNPQP
ncbi:MAG TPA: pectinesterase family protein [Kofleriaceae bacterium]|jgi:pectin methylesterase-like acyl-CoA thioesterase|nr:pectinesterase family protein [Kofleriaceae bacterium]